MVDIDFLDILLHPEKYVNPEYYDMDKVRLDPDAYYAPETYYNPVLKTRIQISYKVIPDESVISCFENCLDMLNSAGIEEVNSNIDSIIETAIHYKRPKLVAYFLDYKAKNNLYTEPDWSL